jgi:hypothetical protein
VKLFDDAAVGNGVLHIAEQTAASILRTASVEIVWLRCRSIDRSNMTLCEAPRGALEMHILPEPLTTDSHKDTLGIALLHDGAGDRAAVFFSRSREVAARGAGGIEVAQVLGCAMAHEIGHLLLRSGTHSREGVMRSDFQTADFRKAVRHELTFTSAQCDLIRKHRQDFSSAPPGQRR